MATACRATKSTMMVNDDDNDGEDNDDGDDNDDGEGNSVMGSGAMGYDNDDDGNGRQR